MNGSVSFSGDDMSDFVHYLTRARTMPATEMRRTRPIGFDGQQYRAEKRPMFL